MKLTCVTAVLNAITSGNRENLIWCVRSVAALKTPHEHLIYDGGSTDGTVELLCELEKKIGQENRSTNDGDPTTSHFSLLTVHSEKDTGIYSALNKGVREAKGEWFYVLGCDDYISRPEVMDRLLAEAGDSDIVVTDVAFDKPLLGGEIRDIEFDQILWHTPYCHQGALMRTESIRQVGGFDEAYRINACYKQMLALHCRGAKVKYCTGEKNRFAVFGVDGLSSTNREELENDYKRLLCEFFQLDRNRFDGYRNRGFLPMRVFFRFLWSPDAALRGSSRAMFGVFCLWPVKRLRKVVKWMLPFGLVRAWQLRLPHDDSPPQYCPFCRTRSVFITCGGPELHREHGKCPVCGSKERHRALFYLSQILFMKRSRKIALLHFAPERCLMDFYRSNPFVDYRCCDLHPELFDYTKGLCEKQDALCTSYEDKSFDVIVANHILEHLPETEFLAEMERILKDDGVLILSTPVFWDLPKTFEDARLSTTPEDRLRYFGQDDHIRRYGADVASRLAERFSVEAFNSDDLRPWGDPVNTNFFLLRKRGPRDHA